MDALLVFSTFPDAARAREIGRQLVAERLAACVNPLPGVTSIYLWQGQQEESAETLALLKTRRKLYPALEARLRALHPYEVPEIVAVELAAGLPAYLQWVAEQTGYPPSSLPSARPPGRCHLHELEPRVEPPARVPPAAFLASQPAATPVYRAGAAQHERATRAAVGVRTRQLPTGQRQVVAAALAGDAQVRARLPPFRPVRRDPPATRTLVSQKMRQFATQRPVDLVGEFLEPGIERHLRLRIARQTGRRGQPPVPAHRHPPGQTSAATARPQEIGGASRQSGIQSAGTSPVRDRAAGGKKRPE